MTRAPIDGALAEVDEENGNCKDGQSPHTAHHQPASSLTSDQRSARRQRLVAHLHAAGPRPCMEALLEGAAGGNLDDVLEAYRRIPVSIYHAIGADTLPIDRLTIIKRGER